MKPGLLTKFTYLLIFLCWIDLSFLRHFIEPPYLTENSDSYVATNNKIVNTITRTKGTVESINYGLIT